MPREDKPSDPLAAGPPPDREFPWVSGLWASLRQYSFHSAFRIHALSLLPEAISEPEVSSTEEGTARLRTEVREAPAAETKELLRLLTDLATGLWRIRRKMAALGEGVSPEEMRKLNRYVESAWDMLAGAKVEVQDLTGEKYVDGMALKVIAFQPTEGVAGEVVDETIKPTVFYRDQLVQRGEVIVTTPSKPGADLRAEE